MSLVPFLPEGLQQLSALPYARLQARFYSGQLFSLSLSVPLIFYLFLSPFLFICFFPIIFFFFSSSCSVTSESL